jgi:cobalt/nickel transport system ATP-binding protein
MVVCRKELKKVRRFVGLVFQNPDDQLFMPTVIEDVSFGPLNMGLAEEDALRAADAALEQVGISHLRARPPYHLSAGEKRRASIASVLSMSPEVLAFDEPSPGLDPKSRRQLIRLLKGLAQTKIIATHDLDMVCDVCDRVIVLIKGGLRLTVYLEIFSETMIF